LRASQPDIGSDQENIAPWLGFFLSVLVGQARFAIDLLSRENVDKLLSPKQLAVWRYLESVDAASTAEIMAATGIVRPTVSQTLVTLLNLKKIERLGQGRATRYAKVIPLAQ
jgi:predicted transcriptional regulator